MKREALPAIYQHIASYPDYMREGEWHVDHQLGAAHRKELWKTYSPSWWIVGQKGGISNIAERRNPDYWWHPEVFALKLPFVWVPAGEGDRGGELHPWVHFGNHLTPETLQDSGLAKCVDDDKELLEWLELIAKEALSRGMLPGIQHPLIPFERVAMIWSGGTIEVDMNLAELCDYPFNRLFRHPLNQKGRATPLQSSVARF
jgi:hypothetical protein